MILVTGGAGFIGSNFIRNFPQMVVNMDALTYAGNLDNLSGVKNVFASVDIRNRTMVAWVLDEHNIDTIVHFAAETHVDRSIASPSEFVETNVLGTFTLLDEARKRGIKFHHVSTDEVYGHLEAEGQPWTEDAKYAPRSPYSATKAGADHLVRAFGNTYGLKYTIVHPSNNYGPNQYPEKLIPLTVSRALHGEPITIHGDGLQVRDWLHVDDCCSAIRTVMEKGTWGEGYNLAGGNELDVLSLVKRICFHMDDIFPAKAPHARLIVHVPDRTGQDRRYAMNSDKIRSLGWKPEIDFEDGLNKAVDWYVSKWST